MVSGSGSGSRRRFLAKGLRACPICPNCGSKKFKVIDNSGSSSSSRTGHIVIVECLSCAKKISI
jgi:ABC-type ATPase with predicted acetyltransferase domain